MATGISLAISCLLVFVSIACTSAFRQTLRNSFTRRSLIGTFALAGTASASASPGREALERRKGLFDDCPVGKPCVSSQDDRAEVWDNPWVAEEEPLRAMARLKRVIEDKLNGTIVENDEIYLRAEFVSSSTLGTSIDDVEFYFAPNDTLIQFRAERLGESKKDFNANRKRLEKARIALGYEKVPVLRNRRRALLFVESPLDTFGPGMYERDDLGFSNRDLVPSEANTRQLYGELDPLAAPWVSPSIDMKEMKDANQKLSDLWVRESDDRVRSK